MYSQGIPPQAQTVLNRLSPEQRQMALMEANRLRGSVVSKNDNGKLLQNEDATVDKVDSSDFERSDEINVENKILTLTKLEVSVSEDLKLEKENFENC